ncbi:sugar transferase [Solirubrobacter phytolaccae]|uniref:Sugar transferase n=1 Tax=Solirubrobacter phytolaccae TaxID=1404360 RepID=A0A9X3SE28_9ACTN|nr:sugar transferase [Solirubrobacter phytolaccae]MDA0184415.1 sugar transferase [Solirubrobacter phytolaccae]
MEYGLERSPDVERAAERLARPHARAALVTKRVLDIVLALVLLVAVLPLVVVVLLMLGFAGEGMFERRRRLGRHGNAVVLTRFQSLPGGAVGRGLERIGARELPLLISVLRGKLSFVGPRMVEPGTGAGHTGPRRLMAPGLIGPAQLGRSDASEHALDDAYVESWSLWSDLQLLVGRRPTAHQSVSKSSS